jgi:aryl-alcohol dehydrogenase-like predicted oxidoreductase
VSSGCPVRGFAQGRRAVELDVTFIDTADSYGPEISERLIAETLYRTPDGRPEHLRQACEGSLARLRLDRIDLYQFHRPDSKDEGKIRHIGVSNFSEDQLRDAERVAPVVSVQNRYNATDRTSEAMVDLCEQERLAFLPWAPIVEADASQPILDAARRHGVSPRQVALAWLLARSPQILPIPGSGSPEHVEQNVAAASINLDLAEIRAITVAVTTT